MGQPQGSGEGLGVLPSGNRNRVNVPLNSWHLLFLRAVKLGIYKVLSTAVVKDFIIFNTLRPLCDCAIFVLQAIAAKILKPRFVTSHPGDKSGASSSSKCHLPIDLPR